MAKDTYLPVKCPAPSDEGVCDHFLAKIAVTHRALFGVVCPECGRLWRIFHSADSLEVEMTLAEKLEDDPSSPLIQVSWGKEKR